MNKFSESKIKEKSNIAHNHRKHHHYNHAKRVINMEEIACNSPIAKVNAGCKVVFSVSLLITALLFDSLSFSVLLSISMFVLLMIFGKLSISDIFSLVCIPMFFIVIGCVTIALQISAVQPVDIKFVQFFHLYLYITKTSIMQAVTLFFRAYSAVLCMYFLATTTPLVDIINFMQKCKFPNVFTELMYMIYRYLFVLFEVQNKLKQSARSRLGYSNYKSSWKSFCGVASGVLVSSFKRSSACYDALESRCYDGELNFYRNNAKIKVKHIVLMLVYVIIMVTFGILLTKIGV